MSGGRGQGSTASVAIDKSHVPPGKPGSGPAGNERGRGSQLSVSPFRAVAEFNFANRDSVSPTGGVSKRDHVRAYHWSRWGL